MDPHCKETFNGAQSVIAYLGKYTHRIAVSNHRILCMDEKTVTFSVKDYKNGGGWKTLTVFGVEFVRRFLMHVPPKRFVRIRHYGILASRNKKKLIPLCRNLLGCRAYLSQLKDKTGPEIIKQLCHSVAELIRRASYGFEGFLLGGLFATQKFQIPQKMGSISAGL